MIIAEDVSGRKNKVTGIRYTLFLRSRCEYAYDDRFPPDPSAAATADFHSVLSSVVPKRRFAVFLPSPYESE
jgi:hypothetical protein